MKDLISKESITPRELCGRMKKYKGDIDEEVGKLYKEISKEIGSKGVRTEDDALMDKILRNFSEIVCMELDGNSQVDGPISFVMDSLVRDKIPVSYTEKFIFGFKDIVAPYLQKEFSERYYAYFTAQKLVDEALRRIWTKSMDRYYHFIIGAIEESEEKFRSIFENAGDGILVADLKNRKFVMANKKICKMLGYSEKELLKLDVSKIHPKKDLPRVIRAFKLQAQKKMTVARGLPVLRKNGTVFYVDISSGPFVLKGKGYIMGFFRPVGGT
jgi:PAS domain S-box-containing protein